VGPASASTTGTTIDATKEVGEPNHAGNSGGRSIWYRITPASSGTATIDTVGSGFDTLLGVYTGGAVNALTQIAANDDTTGLGLQSRVQFSAVANTTYQVAVDGYNAASGTVTLNWVSPSGPPPPPPPSGNTGWSSPTAQAPDSGGDGNGYQTSPGNALGDDGSFALDTNSGTSSSTSCTSSSKDKHRFSGYSITPPAGATVKGVEVQLQAKVDSTSGSPKLCIQLSWNGGTSWTSAKATSTLTNTEAARVLGSASDTWGRAWSASDLGSNFRVRVIDVASSTARDFSLDWVAVRVHY
ncbi:MAG: hypothetical protein WD271_05335, partial [Acidimicrobiia bacterium]